jgi:subtilisin family serine protease
VGDTVQSSPSGPSGAVARELRALGLEVLSVAPRLHASALNALAGRRDVRYAVPVYRYEPSFVPNDRYYTLEYHHTLMGSPAAWDTTVGSSQITIAVLDTGVDPKHPDLGGRRGPG